jgi:hypothetical protein
MVLLVQKLMVAGLLALIVWCYFKMSTRPDLFEKIAVYFRKTHKRGVFVTRNGSMIIGRIPRAGILLPLMLQSHQDRHRLLLVVHDIDGTVLVAQPIRYATAKLLVKLFAQTIEQPTQVKPTGGSV